MESIIIHNIKSLIELFNLNFADFKLTDDEMLLIILTSIDADYFTHMLIGQTDFTQWFTNNYAGENNIETDFREEVEERWEAAVHYVDKILIHYDKLKSDEKEVIFTSKWWIKLRFLSIGTSLKDKLNFEPAKKDKLRKLFKNQNDKISYYDFFSFMEGDLGLKIENWQEDQIENRLD